MKKAIIGAGKRQSGVGHSGLSKNGSLHWHPLRTAWRTWPLLFVPATLQSRRPANKTPVNKSANHYGMGFACFSYTQYPEYFKQKLRVFYEKNQPVYF